MFLLALIPAALAAPLGWDDVTDAALQAWSRGPGAAAEARADGAAAAARATWPQASLQGSARPGPEGSYESTALVQIPLALGLRARAAWVASAEATRARDAADRYAYVERVHTAYEAWWTAHEIGAHLDAWSAEVEAGLAPVDAAVSDGVLAPLDAEDLRAELATVRAEAASAEARAARARAHLQTLLGGEVVLAAAEDHVHDLDLDGLDNPWTPLVDRAGDAPEVSAWQASADAARAQARQGMAWTPSLSAGPGTDGVGSERVSFVQIGVTVPLRAPAPAQARQARGQAVAAEARAAWASDQVRAALKAEADTFDADLQHARRLRDEVAAPLARRLERLEAAFADGLVPADRLIRARRDHHEADHAWLEVAAGLLASRARAEATRRLLEGAAR